MQARNKYERFETAKKVMGSSNDRTRFAKRLGSVMTEQRKEIPELAAVAGCSYEMARRYVVGTGRPNRSRVEKIADWLGIDPDWLEMGDKDEDHDNQPRRNGIPVYKTSDRNLTEQADSYIDVGLRNERLAVKITNPLGIEVETGNTKLYKAGDICIIGGNDVGLGDYVLLEAKDPNALNRYLIRRVEFGKKMEPIFVANREGYPACTTEDFSIVGRVVAVFAMT